MLLLSCRGIGLALVKQLLSQNNTVIATARQPDNASALQDLAASSSGRLLITQLDTASTDSIAAWVQGVQKLTQHLDVSAESATVAMHSVLPPLLCMRCQCGLLARHGHQRARATVSTADRISIPLCHEAIRLPALSTPCMLSNNTMHDCSPCPATHTVGLPTRTWLNLPCHCRWSSTMPAS